MGESQGITVTTIHFTVVEVWYQAGEGTEMWWQINRPVMLNSIIRERRSTQ